jgi:hypothetical protein
MLKLIENVLKTLIICATVCICVRIISDNKHKNEVKECL